MNVKELNKKGNLEKRLLAFIHEHRAICFQNLRTFFPLVLTTFQRGIDDLKQLNLIYEFKEKESTMFSLTDKGKDAIVIGLDHWIENFIYEKISDGYYSLTKESTNLEDIVTAKLVRNRKIFKGENRNYKLVPSNQIYSNTDKPNLNVDPKYLDELLDRVYMKEFSQITLPILTMHNPEFKNGVQQLKIDNLIDTYKNPIELTNVGWKVKSLGYKNWFFNKSVIKKREENKKLATRKDERARNLELNLNKKSKRILGGRATNFRKLYFRKRMINFFNNKYVSGLIIGILTGLVVYTLSKII